MPDTTLQINAESGDMFLATGTNDEEYQLTSGRAAVSYATPKIILMTSKDEAPGIYKALALNFR